MRNVAFWHAAYGKWYEEGKSEANGGIAPTGDVLKLVEAYDRMKAACGPDRELSLIHIYVGLSEWQLSLVNATASVASLLSVGLWARLNEKGSVERTFPFGVAGLMGSSISMVAALCLPAALRPGAFIVMQTVSCYFQGCITLCVVQMLLKSVPEENKALCISLYTIAITLSNSLMPLLGVTVYQLMGANLAAIRIFYGVLLVLRAGVVGYFVLRTRKEETA